MSDEFGAVPMIDIRGADNEHLLHLQRMVSMVGVQRGYFARAVELMDHLMEMVAASKAGDTNSPERPATGEELPLRVKWTQWAQVAARDAALSAYHFRAAMHCTIIATRACPAYKEAVDLRRMEDAIDGFEAEFPNTVNLRHIVAHFVDKQSNLKEVSEHRPDNGIWVQSGLSGRRFHMTFKKQEISLEITRPTLERLTVYRDEVYACFPIPDGPMPH